MKKYIGPTLLMFFVLLLASYEPGVSDAQKEEIKGLLADITYATRQADAAGIVSQFTDDAVIELQLADKQTERSYLPEDYGRYLNEQFSLISDYQFERTAGRVLKLDNDQGILFRFEGIRRYTQHQQAIQEAITETWHLRREQGQFKIYKFWSGPSAEAEDS